MSDYSEFVERVLAAADSVASALGCTEATDYKGETGSRAKTYLGKTSDDDVWRIVEAQFNTVACEKYSNKGVALISVSSKYTHQEHMSYKATMYFDRACNASGRDDYALAETESRGGLGGFLFLKVLVSEWYRAKWKS